MKKIAMSLLCMGSISSLVAMESGKNFEKTIVIEFLKTCLKKGRTSEEVFPFFKKQVKEPLTPQDIVDFHAKYRNAQDVYQSDIDNHENRQTIISDNS